MQEHSFEHWEVFQSQVKSLVRRKQSLHLVRRFLCNPIGDLNMCSLCLDWMETSELQGLSRALKVRDLSRCIVVCVCAHQHHPVWMV